MSRAWFRAAVASAVLGALSLAARADENVVPTIREDVRQGPPPSASSGGGSWASDLFDNIDFLTALEVLTSPFTVPHLVLDDDFANNGYFQHFPYEREEGYIRKLPLRGETRPLAIRLDAEYVATFDNLYNINGHLLVSTAPRLGSRRRGTKSRSNLPTAAATSFRWATATWSTALPRPMGRIPQRAGAELDGRFRPRRLRIQLQLCGRSLPRKPLVFSSELDGGTLGRAGLFRVRTTAGIVWHGVETYVGYQYTDIGRAHWNGLVGGLRLWL